MTFRAFLQYVRRASNQFPGHHPIIRNIANFFRVWRGTTARSHKFPSVFSHPTVRFRQIDAIILGLHLRSRRGLTILLRPRLLDECHLIPAEWFATSAVIRIPDSVIVNMNIIPCTNVWAHRSISPNTRLAAREIISVPAMIHERETTCWSANTMAGRGWTRVAWRRQWCWPTNQGGTRGSTARQKKPTSPQAKRYPLFADNIPR